MQKKDDKIELRVLRAAPGWLAIHKPAGLSVHNDPKLDLCARVHRQIEGDAALRRTVRLDAAWGVHAVHRLDRDTSGVLLMATRAKAFTALSEMFVYRSVHTGFCVGADVGIHKRYLAVVHGRIEMPAPGVTTGKWTWPLSPKAGGRNRPAGAGKQKPSCTRFRLEGLAERYSLLSCEPITGRQHQIRRHAKLAGHPVVGDRRYSSKRALNYLEGAFPKVRLALHAWQLSLVPPGAASGERLRLTADPVPDFMRSLMGAIDYQALKAWDG